MAMQLDIEDIFGGVVGSFVLRALIFGGAVWMGCLVAGSGLLAGDLVASSHLRLMEVFGMFFSCPLLLISTWALLNFPFLVIAFAIFIRYEPDAYKVFGVVAAVESLAAMAGYAGDLSGAVAVSVAWLSWLVLLAMLITGVWFVRQWFINQWARDLGMLRAEIAMQRAENESRMANPDDEDGASVG